MNSSDYKHLINELDWNLPKNIQLLAQKKIKSIEGFDFSLLLQPLGKQYWENAAIILCSTNKELLNKSIIAGLFDWLKDLNWPGATHVFNFLKTQMSDAEVNVIWREKLLQAQEEQDDDWLMNLKMLSK